jgi:hypothetical protein
MLTSERFRARSDDGRVFTMVELKSSVSGGHLDDATAESQGLSEFRTTDGHRANKLDDGWYEIVDLDRLRVRGIDRR